MCIDPYESGTYENNLAISKKMALNKQSGGN
jgi:hypothetical protein